MSGKGNRLLTLTCLSQSVYLIRPSLKCGIDHIPRSGLAQPLGTGCTANVGELPMETIKKIKKKRGGLGTKKEIRCVCVYVPAGVQNYTSYSLVWGAGGGLATSI